jgi:hypothetical protein
MIRVEFELTIPVFGRTKTVNALDRVATVIGLQGGYRGLFQSNIHLVTFEPVNELCEP